MGLGGVCGEPGLTILCLAGWSAEDRTEVEEEVVVVEDEEEEESGSLDEEEIKKMQSDEVCGDTLLWYLLSYHVGSVLFHSPLSPCPLGHSRLGGDSLRGNVQPCQLHPAHQIYLLRVLCTYVR